MARPAAPAALEQDLDLLLGRLQRGLAVARQRDAALEGLQRLIERQIAALEPLDERFELGERLLEIGGLWLLRGHVVAESVGGGARSEGAQRYTARCTRVNTAVDGP